MISRAGWILGLSSIMVGGGASAQALVHYRAPPGDTVPWTLLADSGAALLSAPAQVDGRAVHAVVDTGVTFTTLDSGWVVRNGLKGAGGAPITLSASGGAAQALRGPVIDLMLYPHDARRLPTLAADLAPVAKVAGRPVDMVLGLDVIGTGSLELDLGNRRWRMGPNGIRWPQAATAPLRYTPDRYHGYVEVAVAGTMLRLAVDTGYDGTLTLSEAAMARTRLFARGRTTTLAAQGLGGIVVKRIAVVPELPFGAMRLRQMLVEIDVANGLTRQWGLDGVIGTDLLRRLHAVFDFPAGTMFYVASTAATPAPVRSTIGIQAMRQDDRLSIVHVMAGSPAAAAGWRTGETICAVNGRPVTATAGTDHPRPWNVAPPGTRIAFGMCDGTARSLVAADFY